MSTLKESSVFTDDTARSHRIICRFMDDGTYQLAIHGPSGELCQLVRFQHENWEVFQRQVAEL